MDNQDLIDSIKYLYPNVDFENDVRIENIYGTAKIGAWNLDNEKPSPEFLANILPQARYKALLDKNTNLIKTESTKLIENILPKDTRELAMAKVIYIERREKKGIATVEETAIADALELKMDMIQAILAKAESEIIFINTITQTELNGYDPLNIVWP